MITIFKYIRLDREISRDIYNQKSVELLSFRDIILYTVKLNTVKLPPHVRQFLNLLTALLGLYCPWIEK